MSSPTSFAWELLHELEADPHGIGFLDLDRLLQAWGITEELFPGNLFAKRIVQHPDVPGFVIEYALNLELSPAAVLRVCRAVREIHRILTHEQR